MSNHLILKPWTYLGICGHAPHKTWIGLGFLASGYSEKDRDIYLAFDTQFPMGGCSLRKKNLSRKVINYSWQLIGIGMTSSQSSMHVCLHRPQSKYVEAVGRQMNDGENTCPCFYLRLISFRVFLRIIIVKLWKLTFSVQIRISRFRTIARHGNRLFGPENVYYVRCCKV